MAINTKEYNSTRHTGIKIHDDGLKFLCIYNVSGKRYRKTFIAKAVHSKGDRLKSAYTAREDFITGTEHDENISADIDATVVDYWLKLKDTKGWTDTAISKYSYFYNKHLSKLSDTKIRSIKPSHFIALNASMKDLAPSTRSKAYEILRPLFGLAVV